jgi:hypothetical protein
MPRLADIAIVIPLAPGEREWRPLWAQLQDRAPGSQRILAMVDDDGQPLPESAIPADAMVARSPAGRARQLNAGAALATRPWLWFLHADSRLAGDTLQAVERVPEADLLGYCRLRFHDHGGAMRLTAFGANLRSRWLGLPFGDQGFLLRHSLFRALGRFDERLAYGEDHAFVWAARRAGVPLHALDATLSTSARKYLEHGWWRTSRRHWSATVAQVLRFAKPQP